MSLFGPKHSTYMSNDNARAAVRKDVAKQVAKKVAKRAWSGKPKAPKKKSGLW